MNYVRRIESNIKAGCSLDLGPRTLIVGPNGAGKSTIIQSIELALTGRVSDVAGRATLAKDSELATLIRTGDAAGSATVTLADGTQAVWTLTPGSRAARTGLDAPDAFPLRAVREAMTGSAETARKWLLDRLGGGDFAAVLASIPAALHARVTTLAGGSVLGLPTALETARKAAREEKTRAETLRTSARDASAGLPPPMTPAEIEAAKAAASAGLVEALAAAKAAGRLAVEKRILGDAKVADLTAQLAATPTGGALAAVGAAMITVLRGQIEAKRTKCGLCGGDSPAPAVRVGQIEAAIRSASEATAKHNVVAEALATARTDARYAAESVARCAAEVARLSASLTAAPEPAAVVERRARWEQIQAQEAEALRCQRLAGEWAELADSLAAVVARIVEGARTGFEARVQAHLPPVYRFGLDISDTAARFGLRDSAGAVRPALSGAEWALVSAALAAAVAPVGGLSIVVPEDRPFDPATLAAALAAFGAIPGQVIVATPVMPAEVPAGWTVIAVGAPMAASAPAPTAVVQAVPVAPVVEGKRKRGRPSKADLAARAAAPAEPALPFETYAPPKPCPGCGVDLNVAEIEHSKACDAGAAAQAGAASVGVSLDDLFA